MCEVTEKERKIERRESQLEVVKEWNERITTQENEREKGEGKGEIGKNRGEKYDRREGEMHGRIERGWKKEKINASGD